MEIHEDVVAAIGNTPLIRLGRLHPPGNLVAKVESLNPGGSIKDRIALAMIERAEAGGWLAPGGTIVEPTSGNTGVGLAMVAALRGYHLVAVMGDKQSREKQDLLRAYGAEVVVCPTEVSPDDPRSYYSVAAARATEPGAYRPDQYSNPANADSHYRTTGPEIWRQTDGQIGTLVVGVGTGGTITGAARYLKEQNPAVHVIGVDPTGSIYTAESEDEVTTYLTEGVGEDFWPEAFDPTVLDAYEQVGDAESFAMTRRLVRAEGLLMGGSGGMAVVGAVRAAERRPGDLVVVILPDTGRNYLSKIFDDDWMRAHGFGEEMMRFETRAIHDGQDPDPATGSVVTPIYATSTYAQEAPGKHAGYEYSRTDNPTRTALQTALASLEGVAPGSGGGCVATASGMAATALVGYMLKPGDHIVMPDDAYGGTHRFIARVLGEQGIEWTAVDLTDPDAVAATLRPETRLLWVETPTNPLLRVADLATITGIGHGAGALVCIDNTFATPFLQQPLEYGADLVLHSTTKYLGGHSDTVGGALITADPDLHDRLRFLQNAAGPIPGPFDAYLVLRGLKTLGVRMERHCANAFRIAEHLAGHDAVEEVFYPGLPDHPQHHLATRQMNAFGGMVSFRCRGGAAAAARVAVATKLFFLAESLGGVESLIEVPAAMTHLSVAGTDLEVPPDLVRLSVGIEHVDDLIEDLDRALG